MLTLTKKFEFEACHHLPYYEGKCENLHGHTFKLEIEIKGIDVSKYPIHKFKNSTYNGMIIDFKILKTIIEDEILSKFDHKNLNKIIDRPTAENIVEEILSILKPIFEDNLIRIRLHETTNSYVEWKRDCK